MTLTVNKDVIEVCRRANLQHMANYHNQIVVLTSRLRNTDNIVLAETLTEAIFIVTSKLNNLKRVNEELIMEMKSYG